MKKAILKIFGVAALAAAMIYNVQVFGTDGDAGISLAALGSMAVANNEGSTCCIGSNFTVSPIPGGWRCDSGGGSCCPVC